MSKIQILDDTLASQVAAGEVVERPASVVKELVENSIDAGAQHVTVEMQRGGTALVKVTDDACGMSREDALLSLERHATSKLKKSEDLASILTLGFRGEAVPSIASVSRFRLSTREHDSVAGTEIVVDGGSLRDVRDAGMSAGTCVEVKQIFYNVPARRKFLRAESTESAHVEHQVRLHALATPGVRFTLIKDGRQVFDLAATSDWRVRISGLAGQQTASHLIQVPAASGNGMKVQGYLLPAEYARKGKRQQFVFLNGRPVEDSAVSRALKDGYRGAISEGSHPAAWLWIDMDPSLVDVNVHPAKKEVRFHRPHEVRALVATAVEQALRLKTDPPAGHISSDTDDFSPVQHTDDFVGEPNTEAAKQNEGGDIESSEEDNHVARSDEQRRSSFPYRVEQQQDLVDGSGGKLCERPNFNIIGPLHDRYIVLEGDEGAILLDPVAARERIVYEQLLMAVSADGGAMSSQGLLVPELLELESLDAELVIRYADHFADAGIQVEAFGGSTVKVNSVPSFLKVSDVRGFLLELVDELHETVGTRKGKAMAYETFAQGVAKRVGRHEPCSIDHADVLLAAMFACDLPYCTPDGRPTLIHISLTELDRKFGK
ncbi:MAG: DNA mismatch repair endonuclease MutL [Verrucomicrobiaceae bacterium]|nr:DNA mismatch repair endonuclease MutL [Verrucomicrobiaceae bacterium]